MNTESAIEKTDVNKESFAALFEESMNTKELRSGEVIKAEVVRIDQNLVSFIIIP